MNDKKSRPFPIYLLPILLAFQALSGFFGGTALILDRSGESI